MEERSHYVVMFIVDDFALNDNVLTTTPGEERLLYHVYADNPRDAYFEGVRRAREDTARTFRLNFCKKKEAFV